MSDLSPIPIPTRNLFERVNTAKTDRLGVVASVLCAIHCAVTPLLLLALPAFGKAWSHPATHWGMALIVVPVAALMMKKGYRRHRRKWIMAVGSLGIFLVLAGAVAPYVEASPPVAAESEATGCADACCPSLVSEPSGESRLHIPLASILTTAGGLFLIVTHMGNLCLCPTCRKQNA